MAFTGFKEGFEDDGKERFPVLEFLIPRTEKVEAKARAGLQLSEKRGRKELVRIGNGHQDERAPTHAQKVFEAGCAVGQPVHAISDHVAEVEQLHNQVVQGQAVRRRKGEQRD